MSTTAIFVEVLIIGIQCFIWIALLVLSIFGLDWIDSQINFLSNWTALISILFIAISYTLGIIFDRLFNAITIIADPAKLILSINWVQRKAEEAFKNRPVPVSSDTNLTGYINYIESRLRIARSSFFNFLIILLSTMIFYKTQLSNMPTEIFCKLWITTMSIGLVLIVLTLISYSILVKTYELRMDQTKQLLEKGE